MNNEDYIGNYAPKTPKIPLKLGGSNRSLKALPIKGSNLSDAIDSNTVTSPYGPSYCALPSSLRLDYVCSSEELDLLNPDALVAEFTFWITAWLRLDLNKKRVSRKYPPTLNMLLANLRLAQLTGRQLLTPLREQALKDSNPEKLSYRTIKPALEFLEMRGFITLVKGKSNEFDGACTWCEPTAQLNNLFDKHNMKVRIHDQAELVIIREKTKSKKKVQIEIPERNKLKVKEIAQIVRGYHSVWCNHTATLDGKYLTPWCRRIFTESLDYGGRFYGQFQQLPKQDRARILIDGHETFEPDYSGLHINILYAWAGVQCSGYPYKIDGYDRSTIKAVMLPLLNSESLNQLIGQINKSSRPYMKDAFKNWRERSATYYLRKAQAIQVRKLEKPRSLQGFIEGIPDGVDGAELIDAIKQKHPVIAHNFGAKNIGLRLQRADSRIMASVLHKLTVQGIPALPIHDSVRVKLINLLFTIDTMKEEYQDIMGFSIEVKY
jgi:hypothetical protein